MADPRPSQKSIQFMNTPIGYKRIEAVPGLGAHAAQNLKDNEGWTNAFELLCYLGLYGKEKFIAKLLECNIDLANAEKAHDSLHDYIKTNLH